MNALFTLPRISNALLVGGICLTALDIRLAPNENASPVTERIFGFLISLATGSSQWLNGERVSLRFFWAAYLVLSLTFGFYGSQIKRVI